MSNFKTVLLIDDDPTQIAILSAYFGSLRVQTILHACDGLAASKILDNEACNIDLIVSDLCMPNMDGIEFLRHIKKSSFSGEVVLISSFDKTLLDNAKSLAEMHGLKLLGKIEKPLTKSALDRTFKVGNQSSPSGKETSVSQFTLAELQEGLERNEFVPFYQPKIDLLTGSVIGAEALARWNSDKYGLIGPAEFIPLFEQNELLENLTEQIFVRVACDIHENRNAWDHLKFSINLPPTMLLDISLPKVINQYLEGKNVDSSMICLEVTETGILEFDQVTLEVLSRLRLAGFDLAIDDFGTGAANISNLRMFPYTELKIDQSFVGNIITDAFSAETVRASISLARQLGMRIVAEGVETVEIFNNLKAKGIDQAQGYFIAKPMPVDEIVVYFENRTSWRGLSNEVENRKLA